MFNPRMVITHTVNLIKIVQDYRQKPAVFNNTPGQMGFLFYYFSFNYNVFSLYFNVYKFKQKSFHIIETKKYFIA